MPDSGVVLIKGEYQEGGIDSQYFIKTKSGYSRLERNDNRVSGKHEQQVFMERVMTFSFPRKTSLTDSATFTLAAMPVPLTRPLSNTFVPR